MSHVDLSRKSQKETERRRRRRQSRSARRACCLRARSMKPAARKRVALASASFAKRGAMRCLPPTAPAQRRGGRVHRARCGASEMPSRRICRGKDPGDRAPTEGSSRHARTQEEKNGESESERVRSRRVPREASKAYVHTSTNRVEKQAAWGQEWLASPRGWVPCPCSRALARRRPVTTGREKAEALDVRNVGHVLGGPLIYAVDVPDASFVHHWRPAG
jgi:hypothetical protein